MCPTSAILDHRKKWTRDEAAKISDSFPAERLELIQGDLIVKRGQQPAHAYVIALLASLLGESFLDRIRVQSPVTLPDPEGVHAVPEPDIVVLNRPIQYFFDRHPSPGDLVVVIEVADSTLQLDRNIKAPLYARSGVEHYWIVDILRRRVLTFQQPGRDEYKWLTISDAEEILTLPAQPSFVLSASRLFERL